MSAPLRCIIATGLSVLVLAGTLNPIVASAAPTPNPAASGSASATPSTPGGSPSASVTYRRDRGPFSLTVSPTRLVVGQRDIGTTQQLTLVNQGQDTLDITVQKRNFTVAADGSMQYQQDAPYAASSWVTVSPEQVVLEPGEAQVVTASVKEPANHEPGDYQVALVFMVPASKTSGNIRVNRGVGLPVYITAPGPIVDSVSLGGLSAPGFVSGGSVPITATVTNRGTVHHDFRQPSPLRVEAAGTAEPFPDFTVARGSVRDVATTWDPPFLCVCHPTVTMTSADGGLQSQTVRVIVFPWPWLAAGLGVLLLLVLSVKLGRRRYAASVSRAAERLSQQVPRAEA